MYDPCKYVNLAGLGGKWGLGCFRGPRKSLGKPFPVSELF